MRRSALLAALVLGITAPAFAQGVKVEIRGPGKVIKRVVPLAKDQGEADDEATVKIKKLLRTKKVSFDFVDTPFGDALSFIRALLDVNLVVDPKVKTKTPLTLTVQDMAVGPALQWLLRLGGATMDIKNGAIYVKPDTKAETARPKAHVYPARQYKYRRMIGRAKINVGELASVELYLYEDDLPPETREVLLKLLTTALEAELEQLDQAEKKK
jgi:hypothetical protein